MNSPMAAFKPNIEEAVRLLDIHEELTGTERGRRFNVEVLNKSCIVLTTACWEAFIEDTVSAALEFLLDNCRSPHHLPKKILQVVAAEVKKDNHELRMFDLAGRGWKRVLRDHRLKMVNKYLGYFNTPSYENIDKLFENVLGVDNLYAHWKWKNLSNSRARERLDKYLNLRHSIAHRLSSDLPVKKKDADDYAVFIMRLATKTMNKTRSHVHSITKKYPWKRVGAGQSCKSFADKLLAVIDP